MAEKFCEIILTQLARSVLMKAFLSYTRTKDQFHAVSDFAKHLAMELQIRAPGSQLFHDTLFRSHP